MKAIIVYWAISFLAIFFFFCIDPKIGFMAFVFLFILFILILAGYFILNWLDR